MRPGSGILLAKAERAAATAEAALASGAQEAAAARAFYALLYAAKVRLNEQGVRLQAHSRIAAALGRLGVSAAIPLQEWLMSAIAWRRRGDAEELTYDEASRLVERARSAVDSARASIS